jgi:hypothetical protein
MSGRCKTLPTRWLRALSALVSSFACLFAVSNLSAAPGFGEPLALTRGEVRRVRTVAELKSALEAANGSKSAATILLEDGMYLLDVPALEIQCPGLVVRSASGNRDAVIVRGPDEGPQASVGNVFLVAANDVVIADLTLGWCRYHGIQVRGESPFDVFGLRVHNCRLVNCNQQFIKGSSRDDDPVGATDGSIEHCLFEFTSGWAYQDYTGGIDIHKGVNWIVRDNLFRNLRVSAGQQGISEHAVHFWKRCPTRPQNVVVERNWILNCDRGIGFGLGSLDGGFQGGNSVIRNNMAFNDGTGPHTDVGIGLEYASGVHVDNNTVVIQKYWGPMEYRFAGSSNLVFRNNLVNRPIQRRDSAPLAAQTNNLERVEDSWFRDLAAGDLRLVPAAKPAIDRGTTLSTFNDDVDGRPRPQGPAWDIGAHEFTPSFSLQRRGETDWLVKPDGTRFFSLGVCVVNQGASREDFTPTNPGYAAFQHYKDSNHWAVATLARLKSWNVTTVGGWSDFRALKECGDAQVAFTPVLHVGSTAGAPWWDMWEKTNIARMHKVAREQILPLRDDPRVLGYYSDNEMGWWNAALFELTLKQAPTSTQRGRLIKLLRETYHDQWTELLKDFEAENAASFEELEQRGMLYLRPGSNGIRVYRQFLGLLAERYYALVREVIGTYDPRGLILGDRYQSFFYPEVVRACAPHVDAVSGNLNAAWNDGTFQRFYLDTLRALSGKPVFVSEFYMAANENRSGNRNDRSSFPTVATQKQRVTGFRNTIEALARTPYVVGADWFQYYDEPTHGRGDGENFNFGLVDIHNRPYDGLVSAAARLDLTALHGQPCVARPDASQGVPPAPRDPLGHFTMQHALARWDRERGFVKPVSEAPVADLYLCWDSKAVYLGLYAQDIVEREYYRDKVVPEVDRAEWIVEAGKGKPIRVRLGPFATPKSSEPSTRIVNLANIYLNTRNVAALELPAQLLGRTRFRPGDSIQLSSTFFSHARADRVDWQGTFTLSRNEPRLL